MALIALKIDVDTWRGTREGVPNLVADLQAVGAPACFLFSLGPDQTGRAITRVFRPGFLQKVGRTSVVEIYGFRTLLNGTLLPAPHIGRRNAAVMRQARDAGHEVGVFCDSVSGDRLTEGGKVQLPGQAAQRQGGQRGEKGQRGKRPEGAPPGGGEGRRRPE